MQVLSSDAGPTAAADEPSFIGVSNRIVAFVSDDDSANALRLGLLTAAPDLEVRRGTIHQAIRFFEKETAHIAIVDISGTPEAPQLLESLARLCPPDLKMLVIGDKTEIGFYRMLINELGVAEYMHKPLTRDGVQRVLLPQLSQRAIAEPPGGGRGGHVVAVCGARGGVGTTSIAIAIALELSRIAKGHVALLDLHLQDGTTALQLSAKPGPGLRIALEDPDRADALFLERTAIPVAPRVRLLSAEEPFEVTLGITEAGIARVLDLLCQKFNFVVVDLPVPVAPSMRQILTLAREVAVVFNPDIASLRDTRGIRNMVKALTGTDRTVLVLNRSDLKRGLELKLIEKGLGVMPAVIIPDLGAAMLEAFNLGVPASQSVPSFNRHLAPLLREIAGAEVPTTRSWLRRLLNP